MSTVKQIEMLLSGYRQRLREDQLAAASSRFHREAFEKVASRTGEIVADLHVLLAEARKEESKAELAQSQVTGDGTLSREREKVFEADGSLVIPDGFEIAPDSAVIEPGMWVTRSRLNMWLFFSPKDEWVPFGRTIAQVNRANPEDTYTYIRRIKK